MKRLFSVAVVFISLQAHAAGWEESPEVSELFKKSDVNGTFVLFDATAQRVVGHNQSRANTRFVPASTFMIPHTRGHHFVQRSHLSGIGPAHRLGEYSQAYFEARFREWECRRQLPFPEQHQKIVQEIVLLEKGKDWTLHAKTGWENAPDPGVGWWVGWVQKAGRVYAFALNMDIHQASDANKRIELGKACLNALGVL